ncbi:hypothetical protein KGQ71_03080 [Patescibacteria group bacterium]|nr:hypothetical protein [Patescibacteria group bacterium]
MAIRRTDRGDTKDRRYEIVSDEPEIPAKTKLELFSDPEFLEFVDTIRWTGYSSQQIRQNPGDLRQPAAGQLWEAYKVYERQKIVAEKVIQYIIDRITEDFNFPVEDSTVILEKVSIQGQPDRPQYVAKDYFDALRLQVANLAAVDIGRFSIFEKLLLTRVIRQGEISRLEEGIRKKLKRVKGADDLDEIRQLRDAFKEVDRGQKAAFGFLGAVLHTTSKNYRKAEEIVRDSYRGRRRDLEKMVRDLDIAIGTSEDIQRRKDEVEKAEQQILTEFQAVRALVSSVREHVVQQTASALRQASSIKDLGRLAAMLSSGQVRVHPNASALDNALLQRAFAVLSSIIIPFLNSGNLSIIVQGIDQSIIQQGDNPVEKNNLARQVVDTLHKMSVDAENSGNVALRRMLDLLISHYQSQIV